MDKVTINWDGMGSLVNLVRRTGDESLKAFGIALTDEANAAFVQSQREVPVKTGVLRSSGQVIPPSIVGKNVYVDVVYGGAAKAYARKQHDTPWFNHPRGGKAFYLKDPVEARMHGYERRVAQKVEAMIRGLL